MTRRRLALALVLTALVVLSGCSAFDGPDPTTTAPEPTISFEMKIDGTNRDSHYFEVRLFEPAIDDVTVTYRNGTTETIPVADASVRYGGNGTDVTSVDPGLETSDVVAFSGPPNATITNPEVMPSATAIYLIKAPGQSSYRAWGVLRCRDDMALTAVTFHVLDSGIDGPGVACTSVP
jgi:hypothetical protein